MNFLIILTLSNLLICLYCFISVLEPNTSPKFNSRNNFMHSFVHNNFIGLSLQEQLTNIAIYAGKRLQSKTDVSIFEITCKTLVDLENAINQLIDRIIGSNPERLMTQDCNVDLQERNIVFSVLPEDKNAASSLHFPLIKYNQPY